MDIQMEPDQQQLLRDVQAGRVSRDRLNAGDPAAAVEDWQDQVAPDRPRRATARLKPLRAKSLIGLPTGDPTAPSWPWRTTPLGDSVIEILDRQAADAALEESEQSGVIGMDLSCEQPAPVPNEAGSIQAMVRADLFVREGIGRQRYGTALQPHNGRDMLRDAYEEALDLACYLRGAIEERDAAVAS